MMLWLIVIGAQTKKGTINQSNLQVYQIRQLNCEISKVEIGLVTCWSHSHWCSCFRFHFHSFSGSSHGGPSNSNTQKHHKQRLVNINSSSTNATCASDSGSQAVNEETIGNSTNPVAGNALPTIQSTSSNVITNSCFIAGNSNSNNHNSNSSSSNLNNNGNNSAAVNLNLKVKTNTCQPQRCIPFQLQFPFQNSPDRGRENDIDDSYSGYNSGDEHMGQKYDLTPEQWEERDKLFIKTMSDRGFVIEQIVEDGACLFRSISLQIYGDQDMHEIIRQQTMDYIVSEILWLLPLSPSESASINFSIIMHFSYKIANTSCSLWPKTLTAMSHANETIMFMAITSRSKRSLKYSIGPSKSMHIIQVRVQHEIHFVFGILKFRFFHHSEPVNIFGVEQAKEGVEPLRLLYQRGSHYNAILNPYKPTVGLGLGLSGYRITEESPNVKHMRDAVRMSEDLEIEQTMFEDKLKTTDWEATNEAIEEQIARESYLQWCREKHQAQKQNKNVHNSVMQQQLMLSSNTIQSSSTITSTTTGGKFGICFHFVLPNFSFVSFLFGNSSKFG